MEAERGLQATGVGAPGAAIHRREHAAAALLRHPPTALPQQRHRINRVGGSQGPDRAEALSLQRG